MGRRHGQQTYQDMGDTSGEIKSQNRGSVMPWREVAAMSLRSEFVHLAKQKSVPLAELCKRFCIGRKTVYKWEGIAGLANRSQRPHSSPTRTAESIEAAVLRLRDER